jgi:hypothetical protein
LASAVAIALAGAGGLSETGTAARVYRVDVAPLDEVIAAGLDDEAVGFGEVREEFEALFKAFSTTQDPKALREAFGRFAKGVIGRYEAQGRQFDRGAFARLTYATARRGQMHFVAERLARVDGGSRRSAEEWVRLSGFEKTSLAAFARRWSRKTLSRREFLSAAFVEPAVRFRPPHREEPERAADRAVVLPARLSSQSSYYQNPCKEVAELCYDGCEGGIECWDGECEGAKCCARGSFKCDEYWGWWTCLYHYAECMAEIIIPFIG